MPMRHNSKEKGAIDPSSVVGLMRGRSKTSHDISIEINKIVKSDDDWAKALSRPSFVCLRKRSMEPQGKGKYVNWKSNGRFGAFCCKGCLLELFDAKDYVFNEDWASFSAFFADHLVTRFDYYGGQSVLTYQCARCDGFIGRSAGGMLVVNSYSIKFMECSPADYNDKLKKMRKRK